MLRLASSALLAGRQRGASFFSRRTRHGLDSTQLGVDQKGVRVPLESVQFWQSDHGSIGQDWSGWRGYCLKMYQHHLSSLLTPTQNGLQVYAESRPLALCTTFGSCQIASRIRCSAFRIYSNSLGMSKRQQPSMAQSKLWKTCAV